MAGAGVERKKERECVAQAVIKLLNYLHQPRRSLVQLVLGAGLEGEEGKGDVRLKRISKSECIPFHYPFWIPAYKLVTSFRGT
jgi:hypothetical protein